MSVLIEMLEMLFWWFVAQALTYVIGLLYDVISGKCVCKYCSADNLSNFYRSEGKGHVRFLNKEFLKRNAVRVTGDAIIKTIAWDQSSDALIRKNYFQWLIHSKRDRLQERTGSRRTNLHCSMFFSLLLECRVGIRLLNRFQISLTDHCVYRCGSRIWSRGGPRS